MSNFTKGQTVYNIRGQEAEFIASADGLFIVRQLYEDGDGAMCPGEVVQWRECFTAPPTVKLHAEVARLDDAIQAKRNELNQIESKIYEFTRDEKARMERIKRHDALEELDRYLAGEITHYVAVHDYYPTVEIIPIGKTLEDYSSSSGYGLLTLKPSRAWDKKIVFSVYYKYKDSQGYSDSKTARVHPCCGEEAATAKAAELMRKFVAEYEAKKPSLRSHFDHLVGRCAKFGVEVPESMVAEQAALHVENVRRQIATKQEEIAMLECSISPLGVGSP